MATQKVKKAEKSKRERLIDVLSWSLPDVLNNHLYKVKEIPRTFSSASDYINSFINPLSSSSSGSVPSDRTLSVSPLQQIEPSSGTPRETVQSHPASVAETAGRSNESGGAGPSEEPPIELNSDPASKAGYDADFTEALEAPPQPQASQCRDPPIELNSDPASKAGYDADFTEVLEAPPQPQASQCRDPPIELNLDPASQAGSDADFTEALEAPPEPQVSQCSVVPPNGSIWRIKSRMTEAELTMAQSECTFPDTVEVRLPRAEERACTPPRGFITVYQEQLDAGLRFPIHPWIKTICSEFGLCPSQLAPNSMRAVVASYIIFRAEGIEPSIELFRALFCSKPMPSGKGWCYIDSRWQFLRGLELSIKNWKSKYFYLGGSGWDFSPTEERINPIQMDWGTIVPGKKSERRVRPSLTIQQQRDVVLSTVFTDVGQLLESTLYDLLFYRAPSLPPLVIDPDSQNRAMDKAALKKIMKKKEISSSEDQLMATQKVKKAEKSNREGLIDIVFSWSLPDVLNNHLYKDKVKEIPRTFSSAADYINSFINPLIEETHADLLSNITTIFGAPVREILNVTESKDFKPPKDFFYQIYLSRIRVNGDQKGFYEPTVGDLIALTDVKPKCVDDLNRPKRSYLIALVQGGSNEGSDGITILSSKPILFDKKYEEDKDDKDKGRKKERLFAVYLTNITTNLRIWRALRPDSEGGNMNIIKNILQPGSALDEDCTMCSSDLNTGSAIAMAMYVISPFGLDDSQKKAVLSCVSMRECSHKNSVKLIWGPPGTGKTKTVGSLLFALLKLGRRTLICVPTNTAGLGLAAHLMNLFKDSLEYDTYGIGDIILFSDGERMKIGDCEDLCNFFLDYRVSILTSCFAPSSGWTGSVESMISLLQDPEEQYLMYLQKEKEKLNKKDNKGEGEDEFGTGGIKEDHENEPGNLWTFEEFVLKRHNLIGKHLMFCISGLYTHLPTSYISPEVAKKMIRVLDLLQAVGTLLHGVTVANEGSTELLNRSDNAEKWLRHLTELRQTKIECLELLRHLHETLLVPTLTGKCQIKSFCLKNATLIFCTASRSAKLDAESTIPIELLVVDDANQLKECESTIPLQLSGLRHAILIGDERQLPAMVQSKICEKAEFGRSLFERLISLGHSKHLLKVQYRMHPAISLFPNKEFYEKQILDGPNVKKSSYKRHFIQGSMFGPYSFINIGYGKEEIDDEHSMKNMVEVFMVSEIVSTLFKESVARKQKVSVGCISPYKAQVFAIQEKLGKTHSADAESDLSVNVRSVDGFQGGEEDVIILSTVRCNGKGPIGSLSNFQRMIVALTRARYCLWILGNSEALINSGSVWKNLVVDAKARGCFYNAADNNNLAQALTEAMIDLGEYHSLLCNNSILFRTAVWKVSFSDDFFKSMARIKDTHICKEVISLLKNLSSGWRRTEKDKILTNTERTSSQLLEIYNIKGTRYLIWTVDVQRKKSQLLQVLKIWDVSTFSEIPKLAEHLDVVFGNYTVDTMNRCKCKQVEGDLVVPVTWSMDADAALKKSLSSKSAPLSTRNEPGTSNASNRNKTKSKQHRGSNEAGKKKKG